MWRLYKTQILLQIHALQFQLGRGTDLLHHQGLVYIPINRIWDSGGGFDLLLLRVKKAVSLLFLIAMHFWASCVGIIGIQLALMPMSHIL